MPAASEAFVESMLSPRTRLLAGANSAALKKLRRPGASSGSHATAMRNAGP
jgi:hypothetical protein